MRSDAPVQVLPGSPVPDSITPRDAVTSPHLDRDLPGWLTSGLAVPAALLAILVYAALMSLDGAAARFFWSDEIVTIAVSRLSSPSAIWAALKAATDGNPPGFYIIESALASVTSDPHVSFRVASVLGLLLTSIALFIFVRRSAGAIGGLLAATMPLLTPLFSFFAIEARPYSVLVACLAWAMVTWQNVGRPWRPVGFALLLMAAVSIHFYALVAIVPFGVAELAWSLQARKVRLRVWAALATAIVPLAVFWPQVASMRQGFGAHFWAREGPTFMLTAHEQTLGLPDYWSVSVVVALSASLLFEALRALRTPDAPPETTSEKVLLLALINLPVIAYGMTVVADSALTSRYVLPSTLGVIAALSSAAARGPWRRGAVCLVVLLLVVAFRGGRHWRDRPESAKNLEHPDTAVLEELLRSPGRPDLPVVVSNGHAFLEMSYYRGTAASSRFTYLLDRDAAIKHASSDSVDRELELLSSLMQLDLAPRSAFLRQHPRFLMFSKPNRWDWLYAQLVEEGFSVRPLSVTRSEDGPLCVLYLVERSEPVGANDVR